MFDSVKDGSLHVKVKRAQIYRWFKNHKDEIISGQLSDDSFDLILQFNGFSYESIVEIQ